MGIITLTTDFGLKDYSVSAIKGSIYSELPSVNVVDVSHLIAPFNVVETAYILKNAYKNFPKGTVHIVGVDSELSPVKKHLAIELDGHFFICADNGIISMITSESIPTQIVEININNTKTTFPTLNTFVKVACHIVRGGKLSVIGKQTSTYKKLIEIQPEISENSIKAKVIYIDNYNNIVTNVNKKLFYTIAKGRDFNIIFKRYTFKNVNDQYNDVVDFSSENLINFEGKRLAVFNSSEMLEIAIYKGNSETGGAASLLGITYGDTIPITFFDKTE